MCQRSIGQTSGHKAMVATRLEAALCFSGTQPTTSRPRWQVTVIGDFSETSNAMAARNAPDFSFPRKWEPSKIKGLDFRLRGGDGLFRAPHSSLERFVITQFETAMKVQLSRWIALSCVALVQCVPSIAYAQLPAALAATNLEFRNEAVRRPVEWPPESGIVVAHDGRWMGSDVDAQYQVSTADPIPRGRSRPRAPSSAYCSIDQDV